MRPGRAASLFLLSFSSVAAGPASAETIEGPVAAEVLRVIDGDTLHVRARIWLGLSLDVAVRLENADAPEIRSAGCPAERAAGERARDAVRARVGDRVWLHRVREGRYAGRVVADARLDDGSSLSAWLLDAGFAAPYDAAGVDYCAAEAS